jgi:hypothetical protein
LRPFSIVYILLVPLSTREDRDEFDSTIVWE